MKQKEMENGRKLLNACIEKMQENRSGKTGGNLALYPVLLVFLGEKCSEHAEDVKRILDHNWNNSRFLTYVSITGSWDSWKAETICRDSEQEIYTDEKPQKVIDKCIMEMLETEDDIFRLRTLIKMEFFIESSEEAGADLYDLYRSLNAGKNNASLKSIYLMLNEGNECLESSDQFLKYIRSQVVKDNKPDRICIISDKLSSNKRLSAKEIHKNYRLAADIILLNSNNSQQDRKLHGDQGTIGSQKSIFGSGFYTASYALKEKPFRDIAVVSLQALLEEMYRQEEEIFKEELTHQKILERLGIDAGGQLKDAEEAYQKEIKPKLPESWQMKYLPFRDAKEMDRILKARQVSEKELDTATCGMWEQYKQQKIRQIIERYLGRADNKEFMNTQMEEKAARSFSFLEYLKMLPEKEEILELVNAPVKDSGLTGSEGIMGLHRAAENKARTFYYSELKEMLAQHIGRKIDASLIFDENYKKIQDEVENESLIKGEIDSSVQRIYPRIVKEFVEKNRKINKLESAFPKVFESENDKSAIIEEVWNVFQLMLSKQEEFKLDFEKELTMRLEQMNEERTRQYIRETIEKEISQNTRLGMMLYNSVNPTPLGQSYYLINKDAGYAKELQGREDYILFDNNRTDCIEELQIYKIPEERLEMLQLIDDTEAENENQ